MTDNPAIEAMARAIMCARPNGSCIVKDWQREAKDNPHVETALNQAQAALIAYHEHLASQGLVIVPVEALQAALDAPMIDHGGRKTGVYDLLRAMIAAATAEREGV